MKTLILTCILIDMHLLIWGQNIDFVKILKQYPKYSSVNYSIPDFTYESDKSIEIQHFKEKFKIDSIAGIGDEFDKQIRLLKWVNFSYKHNGNNSLPNKINTDYLVIAGREKGINCGGLAIIMNSVYLSMGFKSRWITCLNNDTTFNDPHTLNIVFSNKYNKWILIDPTYCAYFIDNHGKPLSIEEIRYNLINGIKIKLNGDFHLNSVSTIANDPKDYFQYITRNIFRFLSPIQSKFEYDLDCLEYIHLIPSGFKLTTVSLGQETKEGCSVIYFIDNQIQFWK